MQKVSSSSCYDAIVIKQETQTYRSTPFQVVFSSNVLKNKLKPILPQQENVLMFVNEERVNIPIKIDSNSGRIVFERRYARKMSIYSDSSDLSQDQTKSQKGMGMSSERILTGSTPKVEKIQQLKNQQAPFWHFAWLFNKKKDEPTPPKRLNTVTEAQTNLTKIKQEVYQGQQNAKQPFFHISLCGNELKKKDNRQEILKCFYKNRVEYSSFIKDPSYYLNDANLVVKIDQSIYTWQLGLAILTCRFAFGESLSNELIDDLIKNKFTRSKWLKYLSSPGITKLDINDLEEIPINALDLRVSRSKSYDGKLDKFETQSEGQIIKYAKTPSSELLQKMNLKYGMNKARFVVKLKDGTNEEVIMKIFLWSHNQKVIISDIDGTITKSDILGQILSDWIHKGVIKLYNQISKRDYKIIYLTARAIGQYQQTTKFLESVQQDGMHLPQGPLFMSPDGYLRSFTREVIYKTPDYLKTKILASLNEVFPNSTNPIFCGFGNRDTDSIAYLKINIHPQRIFCISEKSVITRESSKEEVTSYLGMLEKIDMYFPVIQKLVNHVLNIDQNGKKVRPKRKSEKKKSFMKVEKQYEQKQDGYNQKQEQFSSEQEFELKKIGRFSDQLSPQNDEAEEQNSKERHRSSSFGEIPIYEQTKSSQKKTESEQEAFHSIPNLQQISENFKFDFDKAS